jgi:hypothetical protein
MLDVMNSSTGRSFNTEHVLKEDVVTGRYGTGFALGLMEKDVGIAASLAEASGIDAPPLVGGPRGPWPGRRPLHRAPAVVDGGPGGDASRRGGVTE